VSAGAGTSPPLGPGVTSARGPESASAEPCVIVKLVVAETRASAVLSSAEPPISKRAPEHSDGLSTAGAEGVGGRADGGIRADSSACVCYRPARESVGATRAVILGVSRAVRCWRPRQPLSA